MTRSRSLTLQLLAIVIVFSAACSDPTRAAVKRLRVQAPKVVQAGESCRIVVRPPAGLRGTAHLQEKRRAMRWRAVTRAKMRGRRVTMRCTTAGRGGTTARLRVIVVRGGRTIARSRTIRVRIRSVGGTVTAPPPVATREPQPVAKPTPAPSPTATPSPEPLRIETERAAVAIGSATTVLPPDPVTQFESIGAAAADGPVSVGVADGVLEVRASSAAPSGDRVLTMTGTGCVHAACGRHLVIKAPVTIVPIEAPSGEPDAFTAPSPDREVAARPLPGGMAGAALEDEVLVVLGSVDEPGDRAAADTVAQAVAAVVSGGLKDSGIYQLRWAAPQDVEARIAQIEALAGVASASVSTLGTVATGSVGPPGDWDGDGPEVKWPFEQIRAPAAWERVPKKGTDVPVGIIENSYASETIPTSRYGASVCTSAAWLAAPMPPTSPASHARERTAPGSSASRGAARCSQRRRAPERTETRVARSDEPDGQDQRQSSEHVGLLGASQRRESLPTRTEIDEHYQGVDFLSRGALFTRFFARRGRDIVWTVIAGNQCADRAQAPWAQGAEVLDSVISVAATNSDGSLASFSSFGAQVEVSAPGGVYVDAGAPKPGIWSTWNGDRYFGGQKLPDERGPGYQYCHLTGTSQAGPIVAGVAALVRSANPGMTADQVGRCITETAGHQTGWVESTGSDPQGKTRQIPYVGEQPIVDAASAVQCRVDVTTSKVAGGSRPRTLSAGPTARCGSRCFPTTGSAAGHPTAAHRTSPSRRADHGDGHFGI